MNCDVNPWRPISKFARQRDKTVCTLTKWYVLFMSGGVKSTLIYYSKMLFFVKSYNRLKYPWIYYCFFTANIRICHDSNKHVWRLSSFMCRSGSTPTDSKSASSNTVCTSPPLSLPPRSCSYPATSATASRYLRHCCFQWECRKCLWQPINQPTLRKLPEKPTDISPSVRQPLRRGFTFGPTSAFPPCHICHFNVSAMRHAVAKHQKTSSFFRVVLGCAHISRYDTLYCI